MKPISFVSLCLALGFAALPAPAELPIPKDLHGHFAKKGSIPAPRERIDRPIDVTLYDIDLRIFAGSDSLAGNVRVFFDSLADPLDSVVLDLSNDGMVVDEVRFDDVVTTFTHQDEQLAVPISGGLAQGGSASVTVRYHGVPGRTFYGLGNFLGGYTRSVLPGADGRPEFTSPIHATLSEPTAARAWWPCHDNPYDAAEVLLAVTGPSGFTLAAPGLLVGRNDNGDGTATTVWHMESEIPAYLVSIAMADYEMWTDTATVTDLVTGQPKSMPVEYYINASRRPHAEYSWQNTPEMIQYFDQLLSPYPYGDIKYGHAAFNFGGAMEHPTMTSMGAILANLNQSVYHNGPSADWVIAHELVHQWYGDALRLERWGEIWLNEGFASYGEILWLEHKYGAQVAKNWLVDNKLLDYYPGTVRDPAIGVANLFGNTVYDKGCWVLHMLRQVLGDADFFESLRRYAERYRFQVVTTEDFQAVCEEVHRESGGAQLVNGSLGWFFTQWLDRIDRPTLRFDWVQGSDFTVVLRVAQDAPAYRLPIEVELEFADGTRARRSVVIDGADAQIAIDADRQLRRLSLDPDGEMLLYKSAPNIASLDNVTLLQPYPNPFNPRVSIGLFLRRPAAVDLAVYDLRGRLVRPLLSGPQPADLQQVIWDGLDEQGDPVGSAVYLIRMSSSDGSEAARRVTLLR